MCHTKLFIECEVNNNLNKTPLGGIIKNKWFVVELFLAFLFWHYWICLYFKEAQNYRLGFASQLWTLLCVLFHRRPISFQYNLRVFYNRDILLVILSYSPICLTLHRVPKNTILFQLKAVQSNICWKVSSALPYFLHRRYDTWNPILCKRL